MRLFKRAQAHTPPRPLSDHAQTLARPRGLMQDEDERPSSGATLRVPRSAHGLALISAVLLAAGVLIVSPVANAAAPSFRDRIDDTYEIEDFCGSGVTVQAHEVTTAQGWVTDTTLKVSFNSRTTYTYGDRSVSDHWAGRGDGVLVEGDLDGAHTEAWQQKGLRAYLKAPGIGTVTRDAGNLQFFVSFIEDGPDEDEFPDFEDVEVVKDAGNHPDFYEPVWCAAALEILAIEAD
jgi:hypothetical protein